MQALCFNETNETYGNQNKSMPFIGCTKLSGKKIYSKLIYFYLFA